MWVVIVGVVPLIIRWTELKYEMSDKITQKKVMDLFGWSAFSVITYIAIFAGNVNETWMKILGVAISIGLGKLIGKCIVDTEIRLANASPEENLSTSINIFKLGLFIFLTALTIGIILMSMGLI